MKLILMIYSLGGGGAERTILRLADYFYAQGFHIKILLENVGFSAYQHSGNIDVISYGIAKTAKDSFIDRIRRIRHIITEEHPDAILAFTLPIFTLAKLSCLFTGAKVIGCERANPKSHTFKNKVKAAFLAPLCDGMIFQTYGAQGCYPRWVKRRSIVIPNAAPSTIPTYIDMDINKIKICSAGRLHSDKDFVTILKAFSLFHASFPKSTLTIYGEGPLKSQLLEITQELGLSLFVNFAGFTGNILDELRTYDLYLFSSKAEGMPNSLMEAMAIGLPCISTDCEFGPGELIENGKNGFLVPVGDYQLMGERMCSLASDAGKARLMGQEASKIQYKLSEDLIFKRYLKYITGVLDL